MVNIARFCQANDRMNKNILRKNVKNELRTQIVTTYSLTLPGSPDRKFTMRPVHWIACLESDNLSPCKFLEVVAQFRGGVCHIVSARLAFTCSGTYSGGQHNRNVRAIEWLAPFRQCKSLVHDCEDMQPKDELGRQPQKLVSLPSRGPAGIDHSLKNSGNDLFSFQQKVGKSQYTCNNCKGLVVTWVS